MLCKYCKKYESIDGLTYCSECKDEFKKYNVDRKKRLIESGICIVCGSNKAESGVQSCSLCRKKANSLSRKSQARYREENLCFRCHREKCESGRYCENCKPIVRKTARESQRRRIDERVALGLCSDCKKPTDNPSGMGRCLECHCKQQSKLNHLKGIQWTDLVEIWNEQHGRCALSGLNMRLNDSEVDHINPISNGGSNKRNNLRWVTKSANRMKGIMSDEELLIMCESICLKLRK